jgi:DNA-binding transcriptional regulator YdaS (Cro superfamily)
MATVGDLLDKAIKIMGTQTKLACALGVSHNAVYWARRRGSVTAEMALGIDRVTARKVSKEELRPDLFGAKRGRKPNSEGAINA